MHGFVCLVMLALSSLAVYGVMLAGWSSNSKYAFLGCLRSVAVVVCMMGVVVVGMHLALLLVGTCFCWIPSE